MTAALPEELRGLVESGPLAYVSTSIPDGSPQVTAMWMLVRKGDVALFATGDRHWRRLLAPRRFWYTAAPTEALQSSRG
jgi:Pyridoxamine 5'-phosphate oxidase